MERLKETDLIRHSATPLELKIMDEAGDLLTIFDFSGPLSFGAAADLGHHARSQLEGNTMAIVLDFSRVPFLDVSAALAVETIANDAQHSNKRLYMCAMNQEVKNVLAALEADKYLHDAHHFETREQAMHAAFEGIKEIQFSHRKIKTI